jgi:aspartate aminotransferase/aminotransferase
MHDKWIAQRPKQFDVSGIRRMFELGATLANPINLSIGQPDFDVPEEVRAAAVAAIQDRRNGYALSQGMPVLRDKLQSEVDQRYGHGDREVMVTCGASGGLMLGMLALLDPGDEVILLDPFFGMYKALADMCGAKAVLVDTYPDFRIKVDRVAAAITPKTKLIVLNSPNNPTGVQAGREETRQLAELATERGVALMSDEIYRLFCYDEPIASPAEFNSDVIVVDGFSKTYGMPGWRLGFAHGPSAIVQEMIKLQQYSFVCAPHPFQLAGAAALDVDMTAQAEAYRRKRDLMLAGLADDYELVHPGGAFYIFPKVPWGTAREFCEKAMEHELMIIPGGAFSQHDTHFRISYACDDTVLERGIEALRTMAKAR